MIEISTYMKRGEEFVPLEEFAGPFPDEDYIEGAIELSIDGRALLTREEWDYIDQLWTYLVDGLTSIQAGKPFKTYFPDQPIEMAFTPDARSERVKIQVTINRTKTEASTNLPEFISALARAARRFFERMRGLIPRASHDQILNEISRLEKIQSTLGRQ